MVSLVDGLQIVISGQFSISTIMGCVRKLLEYANASFWSSLFYVCKWTTKVEWHIGPLE